MESCVYTVKVAAMVSIVFLDRAFVGNSFPELGTRGQYQEYEGTDPCDLVQRCSGAAIVLSGAVRLAADNMRRMPALQLIVVPGPSHEHVDVGYCSEKGIAVRCCDGYAEVGVAEHALALMMWLSRGLGTSTNLSDPASHTARDLRGKLLGVVGSGMMGRATARLAQSVGMRVVHAERKHALAVRDGYMRFQQVLGLCDVLSLHCLSVAETKHLIGHQELMAMKRGALLINTADRQLVHSPSLLGALKTGHLGGAGLDYCIGEPPHAPNLITTPHVAHQSDTSRQRLRAMLAEHVDSHLRSNLTKTTTPSNAHI